MRNNIKKIENKNEYKLQTYYGIEISKGTIVKTEEELLESDRPQWITEAESRSNALFNLANHFYETYEGGVPIQYCIDNGKITIHFPTTLEKICAFNYINKNGILVVKIRGLKIENINKEKLRNEKDNI